MPTRFYHILIFILCFFTQSLTAQQTGKAPEKVKGKVVRIIDGDTFELLVKKETYKIRLSAIDAPEKGQDYYQQSRQALADLVFGKIVTVELLNKDRYQRWVGDVYNSNNAYINGWLIADGNAWHYVKYSKSAPLAASEANARRQKLGLWAQAKPIAPWLYRKESRETSNDKGKTGKKKVSKGKTA
ncbi:thermonuclease family protein [Chitinophaga sp. CF118]|uniref:thermonuclease family protein n=1 Tax=Chitinophaga sp. CF118 TaxID=1884367 RepID=UPI000B7D2E1A|nr:thermonuclease family protein [Chitinophaga sp. CF118]